MDGLNIIRTIQSNERYDAFEAELDGRKVFAKQAKMSKTRELIAGLLKNSKIVNSLGEKTEFKFRSPKVLKQEQDWVVTEWIDGQTLASKVEVQPEDVAKVLSDFFVVFDGEKVSAVGFRQIFTKDGLEQRMSERLPPSLGAQEKTVLAEAKKLFDKLWPSLNPALQDADIKPDHIFRDANKGGAYVLIDSEHLSSQWPRFYDLGNNFAKYWVRNQKDFSNQVLGAFLNKSQLAAEEIFQPFVVTLIVRGISMHWETDYDPGAERYNIPRSQDMLKVVLAANNLDDLLY